MIQRWNPAYILLVGIAGSFHKEVKLGDAIVSQQVFYYDPGKATESGIQYRPQGYPCGVTLIRQIQALSLDDEIYTAWQDSAQRSAREKAESLHREHAPDQNPLLEHRPAIHFGTVASGSLVIASEALKKKLLRLHGKIVGTESEGAGLMYATFAEELPTPAIVVKGISDAANPQKAAEDQKGYWRELAKENSVRLALQLIRRGGIRPLQTDECTLDVTPGLLSDCRERIPDRSVPGVSFLGFPSLVKPKGPLTGLRIKILVEGESQGKSTPLSIIKQMTEYTRLEGECVRETKTEVTGEIVLTKPLAKKDVGVYLMMRGTPSRIEFSVEYRGGTPPVEWIAQRKG